MEIDYLSTINRLSIKFDFDGKQIKSIVEKIMSKGKLHYNVLEISYGTKQLDKNTENYNIFSSIIINKLING
jgi:hypothetical protein